MIEALLAIVTALLGINTAIVGWLFKVHLPSLQTERIAALTMIKEMASGFQLSEKEGRTQYLQKVEIAQANFLEGLDKVFDRYDALKETLLTFHGEIRTLRHDMLNHLAGMKLRLEMKETEDDRQDR